jgi:hypothetical protein
MLESMTGIAYARLVTPTEPIRPLQDVWLRPRRVFRELAASPVGSVDQMLGAAQGIVGALGYCRAKDLGAHFGLTQIFGTALLIGSVVGIVSLHAMAALYAGLGRRPGTASVRRQLTHVLAYGGVPMAMSLGVWVMTALLAGEVAFIQAPRDLEGFLALLFGAQFGANVLLTLWSVVLQVMGFSEILGVANGKAFGIWVLGQLLAVLAVLFLYVIMATLFPAP